MSDPLQGQILLVDDDSDIRSAVGQTLDLAGYSVITAASAQEALQLLTHPWKGIVICDVRMPGCSGLELLTALMQIDADIPVVMLTGHGDIPMAVGAINRGAYDFLEKPCPSDRLLDVARRATEKRNLVLENRQLKSTLGALTSGMESLILGVSEETDRFRQLVQKIATIDSDVLIRGETGVGKELAARAIHLYSNRGTAPFVAINCGALPADYADQELFGSMIIDSNGTPVTRAGRFQLANGGVVFLDEVESMSESVQIKLLRVLQERTVEAVGSTASVPLNIRVLAATKYNLSARVKSAEFRADLFYRLDVVRLQVPTLRQRRKDIVHLFMHFLHKSCQQQATPFPTVATDVETQLRMHRWPGNIRELRNAAERYAMTGNLHIGDKDDTKSRQHETHSLKELVEEFEQALIIAALQKHRGSVQSVCEELDLPRRTLNDKLKRFGLRAELYKST